MNEFFDITNEEFDDEKDENKRFEIFIIVSNWSLFSIIVCNNRKNRNLSEKKRRDQFNLLINELCSIINYNTLDMDVQLESVSGANKQKTDKSSILRASIAFLKSHSDVLNKSHEKESTEQKLYESDICIQTGSIFSWKPSFLVNDEFIHLMLEVSLILRAIQNELACQLGNK